MSKIAKLREIGVILKNTTKQTLVNYDQIQAAKKIVEELLAEEQTRLKRDKRWDELIKFSFANILTDRPPFFNSVHLGNAGRSLHLDFRGEEVMERTGEIMAEENRKQELPHFKRAEIVLEKFVPEGTSAKMYRFKRFINIATQRELPSEYKEYQPHFYASRDGKQLCLFAYDKEKWYDCIELSESVLTALEYDRFIHAINHAGERLHRIMEKKRELANHKGEERITI